MDQRSVEILHPRTPESAFADLLALEPQIVTWTVPTDGAATKEAFISGDSEQPDLNCPKLAVDVDGRVAQIEDLKDYFRNSTDVRDSDRQTYIDFADDYIAKTRLVGAMKRVSDGEPGAEAEFMRLNVEIFGEPDEATYRSLLHNKIAAIDPEQLDDDQRRIYDELIDLLPADVLETPADAGERFMPSPATKEWMEKVVKDLFQPWIKLLPKSQKSFEPDELADHFRAVLADIGEAADDWQVIVRPAAGVNVQVVDKAIIIPDNKGAFSRKRAIELTVHEVGIHVLRSLAGEQTDLGPLRTGLKGFSGIEEGLGKVMEMAYMKKYDEVGIDHYLTAGLAYFDNANFRTLHDIRWRLAALEKGTQTDTVQVEAKDKAYVGVMRIMRGTGTLPLFKDLSYFNGATEAWKYLESIRGDDLQLSLLLQGRVNASKTHQNIMLESHSLAA